MSILLISVVVLFGSVNSQLQSFSGPASVFNKFDITRDIRVKPPKTLLTVRFPGGGQAQLGNGLTPSETAQEPYVSWNAVTNFFTLVMIDPDAPSQINPTQRSWLHWLVVNIPGNMVVKGDVLAHYNGPTPPAGTGAHRYIILVFQQPNRLSFSEFWLESNKSRRGGFDLAKFVNKYNLGDPIAGAFFKSSHDGAF